LSKEFRFVEEKIYALYGVIRRQEYPKKAKCDCEKIRHVKVNREEDHE
jgi:hypothetical protein